MCSSNVEMFVLLLRSLTFVVLVLFCTVWLSTDTGITDFGRVVLVVVLLLLHDRPLQWWCSSIACAVWCMRVLFCSSRFHSQLCLDCYGLTVHAPSGCWNFPSMLRYFFRALLQAYHVFGPGRGCQSQSSFDCLGFLCVLMVVFLPHARLLMCVPSGLAMSAMVVACRYVLHWLILMAFSLVSFETTSMMH
jgi:hypothetical protein